MLKRTHGCGDLRADHIDDTVRLNGWVWRWRDHGGVIFIDLRDRTGHAQIVFNPEDSKDKHEKANRLRNEFVIAIEGRVRRRPDGTENPDIPTGQVEIVASELQVLNTADTPPIEVEDFEDGHPAGEEKRMKFRYLDLRRPSMQKNIRLRHKAMLATRKYFDGKEFTEVETPILSKSTPEGARDYLVPSRVHPGEFYALPQSPQTFKQILMVSGVDRYFQICRCFRDEDLRADRQPEFTQIDLEMAFVEQDDILDACDGLMEAVFKDLLDVDVKTPIPRYTHAEVMERFGSDKPDLRYDLELKDVGDIVKASDFKVFTSTIEKGGKVVCLPVPGAGSMSRTEVDGLAGKVSPYGAKGLAWMKVTEKGLESSIVKFFNEEIQKQLLEITGAKPGDLLTFVADRPKVVYQSLDFLRRYMAERMGLVDKSKWSFLWVTDFPMFEKNDDGSLSPAHHPFTNINPEDEPLLETDPLKVRSRSFDLVLNGLELGSGSIRIHEQNLQKKVFKVLGIEEEEAQQKFGFLLDAFRYGAPPHGGFAFGFDRLVMLICGASSLREVIVFPKTQRAFDPMTESPSEVEEEQLRELSIRVRKSE